MSKLTFGFCGGYGTGKSYIADELKTYLEERYSLKVKIFSFGNFVREYCVVENLLSRDESYGKPTTGKARFTLRTQSYLLKRENPFVWVDCMEKTMKQHVYDVAIVDDIRFMKEYEFLLNHGLVLTYLGKSQNNYELPKLSELADLTFESRVSFHNTFLPAFQEKIC